MADIIGICNQALLLLAEKTIESFDEDTPEARGCFNFYDTTRDAVLREIKPNFAIMRAGSLPAANAPSFGFSNAYDLPQDCSLILSVHQAGNLLGDRGGWVREGNKLLCNYSGGVELLYIRVIPDVEAMMDATFVECLAAKLASKLCYTLTSSNAKLGGMVSLYELNKAEAENQYGQERSTQMTSNMQLTAWR